MKAEDSEQLAGDKDGLEKPISFPGPSLGSLVVPLFEIRFDMSILYAECWGS